jgi:hypothetical protein
MKANELRIGNLVEVSNNYSLRPKGWEVAYIHAINIDNCIISWEREFFVCNYKPFIDSKEPHINPIPLTEEWLERFGFQKNAIGFWQIKNPLSRLNQPSDGWYLNSEGELTKSLSEFFIRIKYVHNLQNFWYNLTGSELTLKDTVNK